ncbi:MAG: type II secretion system secretin GspD [Kiritimatiellae bacterium]|nr:type II secretion system secretin GspD [Kiritimatiellia bacterium]
MLNRFQKRAGRGVALWVVVSFVGSGLPARAQPPRPGAPPARSFPAAPAGAPAPAEPGAETVTYGGSKLVTLKFRDAPLDQVLDFYAELTGRTMIKSPGINATVTLRAQTRLTQEEAMQAIETILAMNNITLVPMGDKFFKVVQIGAARQEGMAMQRSLPEEAFPETDHLISQIIDLKYLEIAEVQPVIQGLMHPYGKIQPLERTNSILITETAANLQRILEILDYIDRPAEAKVETRIYELRYAEAGKVASRLNELIQDAQAKEDKPRVTPPGEVQPSPPGVIRARRAAPQPEQPETGTAAELAERGIISGKVKIVADDRTNILIVISHPSNFIFFDKIVAVLDRPVEPEVIVRVMALEYADAEQVAGILNQFIGAATAEKTPTGVAAAEGAPAEGRAEALREYVVRRAEERIRETVGEEKAKIGQLSASTKILADKRTNSLLLMGRKSDIAALTDIIDQLDIMLGQVLIEAVILEVNLNDNVSYGIDWLQRSLTVYNENVSGPRGGVAVREPVFSFGGGQRLNEGSTFIDGSTVQRDSVTLSAGALTYYATFFDFNLDAVLRLAAGSSDARILSTPVILTTDNTEAKIIVGEERPVVTSTTTSSDTAAQTSQYEYRNIGINLTVTPRINPQRFVVMEISQTADDLGGTVVIDGNDVPIITKREMKASVAVEDRSTIVLGGLVSSDNRLSRAKIPVLGDIPLLGALFRSDDRSKTRRELLVLLTPYVLMTPEEVREKTKGLHDSASFKDSHWYKGWSESPLAELSPDDKKAQKKAEREQQKRARKEAVQLRMSVSVPEEKKTTPLDWELPAEAVAPPEESEEAPLSGDIQSEPAVRTGGSPSLPEPAGAGTTSAPVPSDDDFLMEILGEGEDPTPPIEDEEDIPLDSP